MRVSQSFRLPQAYFNDLCAIQLVFVLFAGIIKKMLEETENYDLILNRSELASLEGLIQLLEVFSVFTKFIQGQDYATMNTLALFHAEIVDSLKKVQLFSTDSIILKAVDILMDALNKRIPVNNDMIGSALLDSRMHSLPMIREWLNRNGNSLVQFLF